MSQEDWQKTTKFVNMLTSSMDVSVNTVHVALVRFSLLAEVDVYLDEGTDAGAIKSGVDKLRPSLLESDVGAALALIRQEVFRISSGDRDKVPNVVLIVLSNPPGNRSREIMMEMEMMIRQDTRVIVVGLSRRLSYDILSTIAYGGYRDNDEEDDDEDVYLAGDDLGQLVDDVVRGINRKRTTICLTERGKFR